LLINTSVCAEIYSLRILLNLDLLLLNIPLIRLQDYNDEIRQEQMWEMQILQKGSGDATDSETGESGSSSHSVDDNRQNYSAVHSAGECSPVHTKHSHVNTNQTIINGSGTI